MSGLLWQGAPAALIDHGLHGAIELYTSEWMLAELARTLGKPAIERQLVRQELTAAAVAMDYRNMCNLSAPTELPQRMAPDSDDDWVIATALAAQADMIVTGDKPFLGVGTVGNVQIVGVAEALKAIAG